MERLGDMKIYSLEEAMDEDLGKSGTPERDAFLDKNSPSGETQTQGILLPDG